jgi:hypothetical protein
VPWDKCESLCHNTKAVVRQECKKHGIVHYLISCRVTQTYDAGACVYFYFGFRWNMECQNPVELYEEIELMARNEILASGLLLFSECLKINFINNHSSVRWFNFASSRHRKDPCTMVQAECLINRCESL